MSLASYRKYFPITTTDIYLNHAAISPLSTKVVEATEQILKMRSSGQIEVFPEAEEEKKKLKKNLADLIDGEPDNIAIIGNTSEGFNWLVHGLEWKEGDRVLLVENEFPANIYPFLNLEQYGVIIDYVPVRDGFIYPEDIENAIKPDTKLFSISFIGFLNGFRNQLSDISRICRERNVIFSVDGIQGVGALPLSVGNSGIDFLSNGGHKWLMGPQGCGFMYISPVLFERLKPAFAGWLSVKDSWNFFDYRLDFLDDARRFEIATSNVLGIFGLRASTDLLLAAGLANIEKHLFMLGDRLIEELSVLGFKYIGSGNTKERSGIYSFTCENEKALFEYLQKKRIHISLRNGVIRFSPHFYNTAEEIDQVVDMLNCRD
ncbi:MAG: aminotransferase class V-fold PLP-dependent enzyme [Calditrichia bacterium]|nr:aminotransferase class V-fold PLP-dependent enzyme [Calditrichia bacterium]